MNLTFASYNIRKAVGLDQRRDPDRILSILREIDADVVALQEADMRFGSRSSVLPLSAILDHSPYQAVHFGRRPDSIGWHGNALLVRRGIPVLDAEPLHLPRLEPRGAVRADLNFNGQRLRVVGMHLDLSGLRRRRQLKTILSHLQTCDEDCPSVLMGDFNQWSAQRGAMKEFGPGWQVINPGRSFPAPRPVASLDRIVTSDHWRVIESGVHQSALAKRGSDHLPVFASLGLPIF